MTSLLPSDYLVTRIQARKNVPTAVFINEYTQHYCVIPRAAPSGLRNSASCIHDKALVGMFLLSLVLQPHMVSYAYMLPGLAPVRPYAP